MHNLLKELEKERDVALKHENDNDHSWGYLDGLERAIEIVKNCSIPNVVGRSEQLKALLEKLLNENMCSVVGDELIEEALKGF